MLKYIGFFVFAACISIGVQASPLQNDIASFQENESTCLLEENNNAIPQATLSLLMKFGADAFNLSYQDICDAYDKGMVTIDVTPLPNQNTLYTLTFEGCAVCTLDSEL